MPYSDAKLATLAKKREVLDDEVKELKKKIAALDGKIIPEMQRRGTRMFESNGVKVTLTEGSTKSFDWEEFVAEVGPTKARKVQKDDLDAAKAAREVQAGRLTVADIERHTTYTPKAPYITVTAARER